MKALIGYFCFIAVASSALAGEMSPWTSGWRLDRYSRVEGDLLVVDVPAGAKGGAARRTLDLTKFPEGVELHVRCRGENVSKPKEDWLGTKFMLHFTDGDGVDQWPGASRKSGTFDWCDLRFAKGLAKGVKGGSGELTLGLQEASGKVVFDLSTLKIIERKDHWAVPEADRGYRCAYTSAVAEAPRKRGVMLPSGRCTEDDFRTLREWGATLVRYQMCRNWSKDNDNRNLAEYDRWLDGKLDHLDREVLPWAEKYGLDVVVDLHVAPGGRANADMNMFYEKPYGDHFVACWQRIARRFRGRRNIYGYDLINEPNQQFLGVPDGDWWNLQRRAAEAVRAIDPDVTIVIESNGWDAPTKFPSLRPLRMTNVIYQAHMYQPMAFTHQGVGGTACGTPTKYPDSEKGWDREFLRRKLADVRNFQLEHGAKIYIGEFSAIAWAEGADRYLADCISIFEEYGWDWSYHAFREWEGWDAEKVCVENARQPDKAKFRKDLDNPRLRALLNGFAGRQAPALFQPKTAFETTVGGLDVGPVRLSSDDAGGWTFQVRDVRTEGGVDTFEIALSSPTPAVPPRFTVSFDVPQIDAHHKWGPWFEKVTMPPDWSGRFKSRLSQWLPLSAYLNDNDRNRICVAASEARRTVSIDSGLREEDCRLVWKIGFFSEPEAPISTYAVSVRIDRRDVFFGEAVRDGTAWIERTAGLRPAEAPAAAFEPLYSSWYAFHQNVSDRELEAECAEAAKLGMKVLIVDDGWQTDDNNRGYAFTGDWKLSSRRFPDMTEHVRRIHALGMKYMMWYGVPMMGFRAANRARFKGKFLWDRGQADGGYACLDPRFPEVREFLVALYAGAVRDWDVDGVKLDFIDSFEFKGADPAVAENYAGRDIKSLPEAVDVLMREVSAALRRLRPDVLVEFRQSYMGPAVRQYGNMLRAADCPGDLLANRCRTANLRLTSGRTAVHSDMLEWNAADTPENAARFVLSSVFSVIQYSMMLRTLPEPHRRMVEHWIGFTRAHRSTLLQSAFRPHHYEANYPWIEAESAAERIVGVYAPDTVVPLPASDKTHYFLNGTGSDRLFVKADAPAVAEVHDTFGNRVGRFSVSKGPNEIPVPVSGFLTVGKPAD